MKKARLELAREWFDRADEELEYAKAGFKETQYAPLACFLAQQIAEKYLKGFLIAHGVEPPRTHVLTALLKACVDIIGSLEELAETCRTLEQYYIPTRYPGDFPASYSASEASAALSAAEKIRQRILAIIAK